MVYRDKFRSWVSGNIAPILFLLSYFITIVVGNIFYCLPVSRGYLERLPFSAKIIGFETLFGVGYWALLLSPFFVTPIVILLVKSRISGLASRVPKIIPEFSRLDFLIVNLVCLGFVFVSLSTADAFSLFTSGHDAVSSVEARFEIRGRLGFFPLVVIMSILHYLSVYAFIKFVTGRSLFWAVMSLLNAMLMTLVLVLLNMKWPVLIYYGGLVISVFIYTERWPYIKAVAGGVGLIGVYLLVSAFVFRLAPTPTVVVPAPVAPAAVESHDVAPQPKLETPVITEQRDKVNVSGTVDAAASNAPMLLFAALNRMAIAYPYYYEIFTKEGAVCGGVLDQLQVGKACRPSTFVYERIFGRDGFEGRGTSPAPVHVSGYALGGWMVAMFALLCASIILGLFASLPLDANAAVGALGITGAIAGYHFSQLPGEGPLIYDHGVVWVVLLLALYALYRVAVKRLSIKICN